MDATGRLGLPPGFQVETPGASQGAPAALPPGFQVEKPATPSVWERLKSTVTGQGRTEFPEAKEFLDAFLESGAGSIGGDASAIQRSAITSDPAAQVDILRKNIPGLEVRLDKYKNVMLKAPGMKEFAYLNKPGFSKRDIDEFFTPILATLPFLGSAGVGENVAARFATGGAMMGSAELEREALERAAGSEQEPSAFREGMALVGGSTLAPGVPSATIAAGRELVPKVAYPLMSIFSSKGAQNLAERKLAGGLVADIQTEERGIAANLQPGTASLGEALGSMAPQYAPRRPGQAFTPETLRAEAASRLQEKAGRQGGTYGGDTRLMDIGGEKTRALARSAANISPEARQTLVDVIQPRYQSQSERAATFLQSLVGTRTATATREQLDRMAESVVSPAYKRVMELGRNGIPAEVFSDLLRKSRNFQNAVRRALIEMRERDASGRMDTTIAGPNGLTLETWDQVKRVLQDLEGELYRKGRSSQAANAGAIRQELVDTLTAAFPAYAQARGISERVFDARNALEAGEKFVTSKLENDVARKAFNDMSPVEQELFRTGFISQFIAAVREAPYRKNIVEMLAESPAAKERIEMVLGPERMKELEAFLRSERMMDWIRSAVQGNSTTARQLAELGLASSAGALAAGFDPHNWQIGLIVSVLTKIGLSRGLSAYDQQVARKIAEALTSRDPNVYLRGLRTLAQPKWISALKRLDSITQTGGVSATGNRVGRNIAVQALQSDPQNLPQDRSGLKAGQTYQTPRGVLRYNGQGFVQP